MTIAALDYLRLATWDISEHSFLLADHLVYDTGKWEPAKWLQYHGWKKSSIFIGTGEQQKKRHSIINISGHEADKQLRFLSQAPTYYATRIDIQVTIPKPDYVNLSNVYEELRGKKLKTSLISSEKNDTLYLGARTSNVFVRLYEKPIDKMYLRFEFEFKGTVARAIWRAIKAESTVDEVFQHYLKKSMIPDDIKQLFFSAQDGETAFAIRKEIEKADANKLRWLQSIDACVRQALYNHNIGNEVQILLMAWGNEAANVDIILENE